MRERKQVQNVYSKMELILRELDKLEITKTESITYTQRDGQFTEKAQVSEGEVIKLNDLIPIIRDIKEVKSSISEVYRGLLEDLS